MKNGPVVHHPSPLRQRASAAITVLTTGALTLVLVAGMPYVLWQTTGIPWPQHTTSLSDLTARLAQPVTDPLMLELLALSAWTCWAVFTLSVIRETCWYATRLPQLLRDRDTHRQHLADLSWKSSLAALCIGTLVVALLSLWRPPPVAAHADAVSGQRPAEPTASAPLQPGPTQLDSVTVACPDEAVTRTGCVEYTVVEGDSLWDIARTHLGDPVRWPRIYALNKERLQPGGGRLTDPDDLRPGWRLTLPTAHAPQHRSPPRMHPGPRTSASGGEDLATPLPSGPRERPTPSPQPVEGVSVPEQGPKGSDPQPQATGGTAAISVGEASIIGITAAAGLLAAVRCWRICRRRRTGPDSSPSPLLAPAVERAVNAAREAAPTPGTSMEPEPDELITRRTSPPPPRHETAVTIGASTSGEVPLDVLAHPGGCAWTGPGAEPALRALLVSILAAAERQRPGLAHIRGLVPCELAERLLPGLPSGVSSLSQIPDVGQAVRQAEEHLLAHTRHTMCEGDWAVPGAAPEPEPGLLLLLIPCDPTFTGRLEALAARSTPDTLIVLTLDGALPGASTWHIDADGTTTGHGPEPASTPLQLFRLGLEDATDILHMLLEARDRAPRPLAPPSSEDPAEPHVHTATHQVDEAESPEQPPPSPIAPTSAPAPCSRKPIRLHVLGPLAVHAHGSPEPIGNHLKAGTREFLTLLAAYPNGLLASDIAYNLRLSENPEQIARDMKNLRRAVRRTLRSATGISETEFILRHGDVHKLNAELVETDLDSFQKALKEATGATTEEERAAAVHRMLDLYRGPFAAGTDHVWADSLREHLAGQLCDAVVRLSHRAEHTGHQEDCEVAMDWLEQVIGHHPDNERLYAAAIRLHQAAGQDEAAHRAYLRLERHLAQLDLAPDPAVRALLSRKFAAHGIGRS